MRSPAPPPATIDEYIARCDKPAQPVLRKVRTAIKKALPAAEEVISYRIPAYRMHGRIVVYFAAWKAHYSVYPLTRRIEASLEPRISPFDTSG